MSALRASELFLLHDSIKMPGLTALGQASRSKDAIPRRILPSDSRLNPSVSNDKECNRPPVPRRRAHTSDQDS